MPVLVTSNFDDDSIKNEQASMEASEIFKFESVDDDGPLVYYKLTLWAFGWGELNTHFWRILILSVSNICEKKKFWFIRIWQNVHWCLKM